MVIGDDGLEMGVRPVSWKSSLPMNSVTRLTLNNTQIFSANLVAAVPYKDLSNERYHWPSCDEVRPLAGQEHEKQFSKTDSSCTSHRGGFGAPCAARSSKAK